MRSVYYRKLMDCVDYAGANLSLVNVPHPFNLQDFCWRLLLDFYSSDFETPGEAVSLMEGEAAYLQRLHEQKEAATVDLMKGKVDCILACRQRLHEKKCLVVIDGLESSDDWDRIRTDLFSDQPTQSSSSCIIVITQERNVAKHCVHNEKDGLLRVKPFIKVCLLNHL